MQSHLAGRRRGKLVKAGVGESASYQLGGSFLRLEQVTCSVRVGTGIVLLWRVAQDWRDSHLAYLQHKTVLRCSRPSSAGSHTFEPRQLFVLNLKMKVS